MASVASASEVDTEPTEARSISLYRAPTSLELHYENHPANRCVDDEAVINFINELQAAEAKKKRILQFMRKKTSKHVTLRNVRNLVAKLKEARRGSTTVESRLEAGLRRFYSRKGFTATIYVDDDKLAQTHVPDSFMTHDIFGH
ncbi:hypothetical protein PC128_g18522 [Phytophthora cactorum]|nr:hypothetical protein PC128_g18522 [Phytophthora cactorum]